MGNTLSILLIAFTELSNELYALFDNSNLFLLSISSFLSFAFIFYLYLFYFYRMSRNRILLFYLLSSIPMIIQFVIGHHPESFQSYDRAFYSISLMLLSMTDIYFVIAGRVKYSSSRLLLAYTILIFYSFETIVSIPTNFLINGDIELTVWIWFLRAVALQSYYVALIIFIKNSDRIRPSVLLGTR